MRIAQPTPELPVPDVRAAQEYYRDHLGFDIAWHDEAGGIGAVNCGECAIFFRQSTEESGRSTFWIFAEDIDATYADLTRRGASITEPIRNTSWGMRQFTVQDCFGNVFYFHHDI